MKPSLNKTAICIFALAATLANQGSLAQTKGEAIEVRLVAKEGGVSFASSGGQSATVQLEASPLLRTGDFARAEVRRTKGQSTRQSNGPEARPARGAKRSSTADLEITFGERGKVRFNAAAALVRDRRFCVVINGSLKSCSDFASSPKDSDGQVIAGLDRAEARRLTGALAKAIRSIETNLKAAERATQVASARELLEVLYRRAVRNRGPSWISGDEREAFLVRDLVDLWDRVDVAMAVGSSDAVFSSDPVAATNGLTLKGYQVDMEQERATMATANVTLRYAENAPQQVVRFILVKERGNWRIADIGNGGASLKGALQAYLRPPATPREK
jgi:hypothetical protein